MIEPHVPHMPHMPHMTTGSVSRVRGDGLILPRDCSLLPLDDGALLVSREHAVFCRVPLDEVDAVRASISGEGEARSLSPSLTAELERHGFFAPPRAGKPDVPSVQLQLTNACNLACGYCCTNSGKPRAAEVGYETMLRVVRDVPDAVGRNAQVALLGGEPLVVPWATDLASEVLDLGLDLTIFTNGMPLVDDGLAKKVAALVERGASVRVSLAGPSSSSCDALSGSDRFEAAIAGLEKLAAHGGRAAVDVMLVPEHVDEIAREMPRLRERLPAGTPIALGVLYTSGREAGEHLFPGRRELEVALDRIAFEAGETVPASSTSPVADRREGCSCALGRHVHVRSDGALFNCFKMEEKLGDIGATGFAAGARAIRENPRPAPDLPACANC